RIARNCFMRRSVAKRRAGVQCDAQVNWLRWRESCKMNCMSLRMLFVAGITVMTATGSAGLGAQSAQRGTDAKSEAAAIQQFDEAIARYVALRESLIKEKIAGPVPNATAPELNRAGDTLAPDIQRAPAK